MRRTVKRIVKPTAARAGAAGKSPTATAQDVAVPSTGSPATAATIHAPWPRREFLEPPNMSGLRFIQRCYEQRMIRESAERKFVLATRDRLIGPKEWNEAPWEWIKARLYYVLEYEQAWIEGRQDRYHPKLYAKMEEAFRVHSTPAPNETGAYYEGDNVSTKKTAAKTEKTEKTEKTAPKMITRKAPATVAKTTPTTSTKTLTKKPAVAAKPAEKTITYQEVINAPDPAKKTEPKTEKKTEGGPSTKQQVHAAWSKSKIVTDLLGKYPVKDSTIRSWCSAWARGDNLPKGAK